MLFLALLGFLIFHIYLVFSGYSTIEFCEKRTRKVSYEGKSPYNLSCLENIKEALGQNCLLWFFPIKYRTSKEDGLKFTMNESYAIEEEDNTV
jgi:hypothetical protein